MALELKIKTNADLIQKRYKRIQSKFKSIIQKGILQAGFQLLDIIRTKTQKGIDYNDRRFAPYSSGYLRQLQREGKKTAVDLFYTGRMLGSLTPDSIKKTGKHKITLGFTNSEMRQRALFNQVLNEPTRAFFGFNKRTENIIQRTFNKFIEKQMRSMKI